MSYKTPGVYVEEHNSFSASVTGLSSAIPVFIGQTEKLPKDYDVDEPKPIEIRNLLDYQTLFGAAPAEPLVVEAGDDNTFSTVRVSSIEPDGKLQQIMYYNLQLFFNNGGGTCYVVSLGTGKGNQGEQVNITKGDFSKAINCLETKPEITLITLTDAAYYLSPEDKQEVYQNALEHCQSMPNRFVIFDTEYGEIDDLLSSGGQLSETGFRTWLGTENLNYGAAYTPYLDTNLLPVIHDSAIKVGPFSEISTAQFRVVYTGQKTQALFEVVGSEQQDSQARVSALDNSLTIEFPAKAKVQDVLNAWETEKHGDFLLYAAKDDKQKQVAPQPKVTFTPDSFFQIEQQGLVVTYAGDKGGEPELQIDVKEGDKKGVVFNREGNCLIVTCTNADTEQVSNQYLLEQFTEAKLTQTDLQNFSVTLTSVDVAKHVVEALAPVKLSVCEHFTNSISGLTIGYNGNLSEGSLPDISIELTSPTSDPVTSLKGSSNFQAKHNGLLLSYAGSRGDKPQFLIEVNNHGSRKHASVKFSCVDNCLKITCANSKDHSISYSELIECFKDEKRKSTAEQNLKKFSLSLQDKTSNAKVTKHKKTALADAPEISFTIDGEKLAISAPEGCKSGDIANSWEELPNKANFTLEHTDSEDELNKTKATPLFPVKDFTLSLTSLKDSDSQKYNQALSAVRQQAKICNFPPSGAIAGLYNKVDQDKGVWNSPANVAINSVIAPVISLTAAQQEDLNEDSASGKSINAIRPFLGKGTLVWGARTLDGNSNDWRYISVRRLISYIESTVQSALQRYVFAANNAMTWLQIRALIEPFLEGLWQQGALVGSTQQDAFFVNIGLGTSMTSQDILEGRMKVNIGLAAVRPAEFIILDVTQLQQN